MGEPMRKLTLIWIIVGFATLTVATPASASSAAEQDSFNHINAERTQRGKSGLTWSQSLADIAREHSADMAKRGELFHNDNLGDQVQGWSALGENVGEGLDESSIHAALMDSSSHRANILGSFTRVGVGAVWADGELWLTQVFMTPQASSTAAPAPSSVTRRSAPARSAPVVVRYQGASVAPVRAVHAPVTVRPRKIAREATAVLTMAALTRLGDQFEG